MNIFILLPETANSIMAKPSLKSASNSVNNVEIRTQQYTEQGQKGYTKIVITTSKPVEITSQIQTLKETGYQLSDKDYKELLSQAVKKPVVVAKKPVTATAKKEIKPAVKTPIKVDAKTTATAKKASAKKTQIITAQKPVQKAATKVVQKTAPKAVTAKKQTATKVVTPVVAKVSKPKTVAKPQVIKQQIKPVASVKPEVKPQGAPQTETQIKQPAEQPSASTAEPQVEPQIQNPTMQEPLPKVDLTPEKIVQPAPAQPVGRIQEYKNIIKNNLYTVVGLASIPLILFLLLLINARKTVKKLRQQKSEFATNLKEQSSTATDYSENITEEMSWKEKFKTYVDTTKQAEVPAKTEELTPSDNQELDDLFGIEKEETVVGNEEESEEESIEVSPYESSPQESQTFESPIFESSNFESSPQPENYQETQPYNELDEFDELINQEDMNQEEVSIDALFGEDEYEEYENGEETEEVFNEESFDEKEYDFISEISEEPEFNEEMFYEEPQVEEAGEEANELIKSEFSIDEEKGFYLVDFEDTTALVGHIADEIFVLKKFDEKIEAPIQARLNEKKESSTNYMTKVGNFKALVEVTPTNMNLLIEL